MKKYKILRSHISSDISQTISFEDEINRYAENGYEIVNSVTLNNIMIVIMKTEKKDEYDCKLAAHHKERPA